MTQLDDRPTDEPVLQWRSADESHWVLFVGDEYAADVYLDSLRSFPVYRVTKVRYGIERPDREFGSLASVGEAVVAAVRVQRTPKADGLSLLQTTVIDFETGWRRDQWGYDDGRREEAIRVLIGITETRHAQTIAKILQDPALHAAALKYAPTTTAALRRRRDYLRTHPRLTFGFHRIGDGR